MKIANSAWKQKGAWFVTSRAPRKLSRIMLKGNLVMTDPFCIWFTCFDEGKNTCRIFLFYYLKDTTFSLLRFQSYNFLAIILISWYILIYHQIHCLYVHRWPFTRISYKPGMTLVIIVLTAAQFDSWQHFDSKVDNICQTNDWFLSKILTYLIKLKFWFNIIEILFKCCQLWRSNVLDNF